MAERYLELEVSGPPRELGCQLGESAREQIRGFAAIAMERVNKTVAITEEAALAVARDCIAPAGAYAPDMIAELEGVCEGSGVPLDRLMLLQVRNQLRPEGCTALSLAAEASSRRGRVVAQNWDNDPALDEFTIVLRRRPSGKPAIMDVTQAGLIAYIGLNSEGIGLCMNTLPAPSRRAGVPHYFTVRGIYEASTLEQAVHAVERASRAIPANILLSTPQGPADLEVTVDAVHVLRDREERMVTHTNHCLHPDLVPVNEAFPELIQSRPRKRRIDALLAGGNTPPSLADIQDMLRDHQGYPRSICRHANEDPDTGFWTTVFSVILEPEAGRMHVSRGNPCLHSYETYQLN